MKPVNIELIAGNPMVISYVVTRQQQHVKFAEENIVAVDQTSIWQRHLPKWRIWLVAGSFFFFLGWVIRSATSGVLLDLGTVIYASAVCIVFCGTILGFLEFSFWKERKEARAKNAKAEGKIAVDKARMEKDIEDVYADPRKLVTTMANIFHMAVSSSSHQFKEVKERFEGNFKHCKKNYAERIKNAEQLKRELELWGKEVPLPSERALVEADRLAALAKQISDQKIEIGQARIDLLHKVANQITAAFQNITRFRALAEAASEIEKINAVKGFAEEESVEVKNWLFTVANERINTVARQVRLVCNCVDEILQTHDNAVQAIQFNLSEFKPGLLPV